MIDTGIAVRYARAFYELARENGGLAEAAEDMAALARIFREVEGVKSYCLRREAGGKEDLELLRAAFFPYIGEPARRLLQTAVQNGRTAMLPFLPDAFQRVTDREENIQAVLIETAVEGGSDIADNAVRALAARTGRNVRIEFRVVPEILGGMRIYMDSRLIDLSTAHRLSQLRRWIKGV